MKVKTEHFINLEAEKTDSDRQINFLENENKVIKDQLSHHRED